MAIDVNKKDISGETPVVEQKIDAVPSGVERVGDSIQIGGTGVSSESGLSASELMDPNSIKVTIADKKTPIVVLYGPPSCGKTMTLVRLTRYLVSQGYTVVPDKTFRPTFDTTYKDMCEHFNQMINSDNAAQSTSHISFMLVKVLKDGKPICQLLEAPGELYFTPDDPDALYPAYVYEILNEKNRKLWAIMLEPDWEDSETRANYVTRIRNLKPQMTTHDKVLFVFNKIDKTPYVYNVGHVNTKEAIRNAENLYPNIFVPFENRNPITKWFTKYNCEFVPFMTGSFTTKNNGGLAYIAGNESYARNLWDSMLELLKG